MPLCGFNKEMIDSLAMFHQGLITHGLIDRSRMKGKTLDEQLSLEIQDMDRFLRHTDGIRDENLRNLVVGLTMHAKGFYGQLAKEHMGKYQTIMDSDSRLFSGMDKKYYTELKGKPDDMRLLVEWINSYRG